MIVYRDGPHLKLKFLLTRNATRSLVVLISQVYVHIPGEGCNKVSGCFAKRNNKGVTSFRIKTKVRIVNAKANQSSCWHSVEL